MRSLRRLFLLALAAVAIGLASLSGIEARDDVSLPDVNGTEVRLGDLQERLVVLYFFSLDRAVDQEGARLLEEQIWKRCRRWGVQVFGIGEDATVPEVRRFVNTNGISYPVLADTIGVTGIFCSGGAALRRAMTLVFAPNEGVVYRGYGCDGTAIVSMLRDRPLPTEVDESTWGKIKELFR